MRRAELQAGGEVIDHLGHQPRPVDRVDRADREAPGHRGVIEHPLHHRLGIIEGTFDRDVVDVGGQHRGHLPALDVADPPLGVEHENVDPGAPRHGIDRRRTGIAAGRPDDGQRIPAPAEEFLEQQAEQLERDVLECQGRPVKQLEQPLLLVELFERRHRLVGKAAIGLGGQFEQAFGGEASGHERGHDPRGQLGIGQPGHCRDLVLAEARPFAR